MAASLYRLSYPHLADHSFRRPAQRIARTFLSSIVSPKTSSWSHQYHEFGTFAGSSSVVPWSRLYSSRCSRTRYVIRLNSSLQTATVIRVESRIDVVRLVGPSCTTTQRQLHNTRCLSDASQPDERPSKSQPQQNPQEPAKGLTDRLADARERTRGGLVNARERTKDVTSRVKASLTNLTPHENIYNLPNLLTVSRLFAAPLTAYLLLHDQHSWALAVFAYAGFTDLVDGWMARKWKLQTVAGSVIDPMADKALMIIVTVTLAVKAALPAYLATLILGRDASLAIAAIWYRYASLPAPKTLARYWDFSLPSAEVHPTTVSKYNTFLQLVLIGSTLALPVVTADNHHLGMLHDLGLGKVDLHQAMLGLQILVAGTTAWSGLSYALLKNAVTIIGSDETVKARQGAIGRAIIGVSFGAVVLAAAYLGVNEIRDKKSEDVKK